MVQSSYAAHASNTPRTLPRFEVHADRCPQALAKIVGTFANLDLVPRNLRMRQSCGGMWLAIEIDVEPSGAERLAERLRAMVPVRGVVLIQYQAVR